MSILSDCCKCKFTYFK